MRRKYLSCLVMVLVLGALVLTSGCGVKINGKEYELYNAGENNNGKATGSESANTQIVSEDKQDTEELVLTSNNGNIVFKKSTSSKIEIETKKKVRGLSSKDKQTILDNMNVKLEREGNISTVVIKTDDEEDFWEWQKENYRNYNITINYDISIPEEVKALDINLGAGNIDIEDISAKLSVKNGAGNIDLDEVSVLKNSSIDLGAGNIDYNGTVDNATSLYVNTGAGNIDFEIPENSKMTLDAKTGVGILSGDFVKLEEKRKFHFSGKINGGGTDIGINVGVGNIDIDEN